MGTGRGRTSPPRSPPPGPVEDGTGGSFHLPRRDQPDERRREGPAGGRGFTPRPEDVVTRTVSAAVLALAWFGGVGEAAGADATVPGEVATPYPTLITLGVEW